MLTLISKKIYIITIFYGLIARFYRFYSKYFIFVNEWYCTIVKAELPPQYTELFY